MNNKLLYLKEYEKLDIDIKHIVLQQIGDHYGFKIKEFTNFERYGVSLYTAIYEYNNAEFVFVPGNKLVPLGWKKSIHSKQEDSFLISYIKSAMFDFYLSSLENNHKYFKYRFYSTIETLEEDLGDKEFAALDKFLIKMTLDDIDNSTSIYRKVDIPPMLVERKSESLNWMFLKEIPSDEIADSPVYFKVYQEIIKSGKSYIIKEVKTKSDTVKKQKYLIYDKGMRIYNYKEFNHNEIVFQYKTMGYHIPDLNQWEYLASTGIQKLFVEDNVLYKKNPVITPNGFGLYICNNVYEPEIISDNQYNYKGGDGGFYNTYMADSLTNFSLSPFHNTKASNYNYTDLSGLYARKIIPVNLSEPFKPKVTKRNINKFIKENLDKEHYDAIIYAVNSVKYEGLSFLNAVRVIEIYHMEGFINQSLLLVEKFMQEGAYHPEFLYLAGYTYFRLQDLKKASKLLKKAVSLKRNMPECYQLLSYIYHKADFKENLEKAFHDLFVLAPEVANGMVPIIFPKGITQKEADYEDLWNRFFLDVSSEFNGNDITTKNSANEIVLLNTVIQLITKNGIAEYINRIADSANEFVYNIICKIESSKFITDNGIYLTHDDFKMAKEEFTACKNIFYEINNINKKELDKDYIQSLTNTFFDCFPALITFAFIHYSNSRVFEAALLFDTEFNFCTKLYHSKQIPIEITDKLRSILEEFVMNITTNIYTYYQLNNMISSILNVVNNITAKMKNNNQNVHLIEQSVLHDLTYILKWFKIGININAAN